MVWPGGVVNDTKANRLKALAEVGMIQLQSDLPKRLVSTRLIGRHQIALRLVNNRTSQGSHFFAPLLCLGPLVSFGKLQLGASVILNSTSIQKFQFFTDMSNN